VSYGNCTGQNPAVSFRLSRRAKRQEKPAAHVRSNPFSLGRIIQLHRPALQDRSEALVGLIGEQASEPVHANAHQVTLDRRPAEKADIEVWERHIEETIQLAPDIADTDRESLIIARREQGLFKERVTRIEQFCRVTKVDRLDHLRASHCKPWRDSTNQERLDGENGLLLTPSIDHLFDRGFISFEDTGRLIISPVADSASPQKMGVSTDRPVNVGVFTEGQRHFLDYHRNSVLLRASR